MAKKPSNPPLKPKGIIVRAALGLDPPLDDALEPPIPLPTTLAASPIPLCTENSILYNHHLQPILPPFFILIAPFPIITSCSILSLPSYPTKKLQYELQGSLCHCCPSRDRLGRRSYCQLSRFCGCLSACRPLMERWYCPLYRRRYSRRPVVRRCS